MLFEHRIDALFRKKMMMKRLSFAAAQTGFLVATRPAAAPLAAGGVKLIAHCYLQLS